MLKAVKQAVKSLLVISAGIVLAAALVFHDPLVRDRAYGGIIEAWDARWPFALGAHFPTRLGPVLESLHLVRTLPIDVGRGVLINADPTDSLGRELLIRGTWEEDTWEVITSHLPPGATFVDVGAHIGYYSTKAGNLVGPAGRVVAIEPNPESIQRLRANLALNALTDRVIVCPFAVFEKRSTLQLYLSNRFHSTMASLSRANADATPEGSDRGFVNVPALPLDDILESLDLSRVDVIKIDVEGAELSALRGTTKTLARYRPVLVVEVIDRQLRNMGASEAELRAFLSRAGYAPKSSLLRNIAWLPRSQLTVHE